MLQIIEGPSGSGKSYLVYKELIQAAVENPDRQYFLVVPEQFTMQAQRDIVTMHPQHGTMNIDIVSFNRLAYRVFEELNIRCDHILEDFGKSMLLQKILMEHRKELPIFGVSYNKAGFLDELKSLLTELFQYRIHREDIQTFHDEIQGNTGLKQKLTDLLFVYDAFEREIQGKYIIAEHILEMLAAHIAESELLAGSVLYFDGFTGFTPIQYEVLEPLLEVSDAVTVTVTIDRESMERESCEEHSLFYLSKDTITRLLKLAERLEIYGEERYIGDDCPRFAEAPELKHLEANLFRYPYQIRQGETTQIQIQVMRTPRQELHQVARQIHAMVRQGQYRYQDIAVIHGGLEGLEPLVEELFPRLEIPYFIDMNRSIYTNPCLECIRAVLEIVLRDYSYESVFRLLKTGVTTVAMDQLEELENYVIRKGIRGYSWWKRVFSETAQEQWEQGREPIEIYLCGHQVLEILEPVSLALRQAETVQEYVEALVAFLAGLGMEEQLTQAADAFDASGDLVQARAFRQIEGKLAEIWEKLNTILGTEQMTLSEFQRILESGLSDIALGVIPPSLDQVTVGDIERTRLNHVKVLFVMGVNDGIIPRVPGSCGILTEADRSILGEKLLLAPDSRSRVFTEQFYLYQNVTKPSDKLYLTYHAQDEDGGEVLPAYLIGRIRKLFPELCPQELMREELTLEEAETGRDSTRLLTEGVQTERSLTEEEQAVWKGLYQYYEQCAPEVIEGIRSGVQYHNLDHYLSKETADRLYGRILNASVSRLETYSQCPYQFFLEYGLKLQKREQHEVTYGDMGSLLHHVVEQVFRRVENRKAEELLVTQEEETENAWSRIRDEELVQMVSDEIRRTVEQEPDSIYLYSHANRHLLHRIEQLASYAVVDLKEQLLQSKMIPYRFELAFNRRNADELCRNLSSAHMELGDGRQMNLSGVVDRLDICQDDTHVYVKVLDYKSSKKEIDVEQAEAGLQLQLLVYTNVVIEALKKKFPDKEIVPSGSLYYGFRMPMVEKKTQNITDTLVKNIRKETALIGIVNREEPALSYLGRRELLPVRMEKVVNDGKEELAVQESDTALSTEEYQQVLEEAKEMAVQIGTDMMEGKIPIRPVRTGRKLPCTYCEYQNVCKIDCRDGGNQIYTVQQLRRERKRGGADEVDG